MVKIKDKGILGAFLLFKDDNDFEGFKARLIHKVLTPSGSRETHGNGTASSTTTAGFSYPHTAMGGKRRLQPTSQDRYMPVILNLEMKNLLDDNTSTILKTLILEENVDIYRVINSHLAHIISEKQLSFKLTRLA